MGWRRFWRRVEKNVIRPVIKATDETLLLGLGGEAKDLVEGMLNPAIPGLAPLPEMPGDAPGIEPLAEDLQRIRKARRLRSAGASTGRAGTIMGDGVPTRASTQPNVLAAMIAGGTARSNAASAASSTLGSTVSSSILGM